MQSTWLYHWTSTLPNTIGKQWAETRVTRHAGATLVGMNVAYHPKDTKSCKWWGANNNQYRTYQNGSSNGILMVHQCTRLRMKNSLGWNGSNNLLKSAKSRGPSVQNKQKSNKPWRVLNSGHWDWSGAHGSIHLGALSTRSDSSTEFCHVLQP